MGHFSNDEIGKIHDAAMESGLANQRVQVMAGINPYWLATVDDGGNAIGQLLVDLHTMNTAELADNSVPFDIWLSNAARLSKALKTSATFLSFQIRLRERSMNAPPIPDAAAVPEAKTTLERPERVIVSDDRLPYTWLAAGVRTGESVLKLEVPRYFGDAPQLKHGEPVTFAGTGWIVAPNIVMTCRHVIEAREYGEAPPTAQELKLQALATRIVVGFDSAASPTSVLTTSALLFEDRTLDVALLEIKEPSQLRPLTLRKTAVELQPKQKLAVNIIQHPFGKYKRLGFRNNTLSDAGELVLRYFTDTDPGSSGSPLCDDEWRVIGIHRASVITKETKFLDSTTTYINTGHQIAAVLAALEKQKTLWECIHPHLSLVP
jgi:endonuclease G, mitochondrial